MSFMIRFHQYSEQALKMGMEFNKTINFFH